jgi:hypothetical protein
MMLPLGRATPRYSAWLMLWRSMAWLAASRTRRSCQGDFGSHWSGRSSQNTESSRTESSRNPAVLFTASASGPRKLNAISTSPDFSAAKRVASSGIDLRTRRFTDGVLRQ